jgi:hypothetical protein
MKTREYIDDRSSIGFPDLRSNILILKAVPTRAGVSKTVNGRQPVEFILSKVEALTTHFLRRSFGFTHELLNLDHESKNGPETMMSFRLTCNR